MKRPRSAYAGLARSACSDCGSRSLAWYTSRDLAFEVDPGERLRVFEVIDFVGPYADAWLCHDCGNWGIFDRTHSL